jgi:phosphate transport system permease protein
MAMSTPASMGGSVARSYTEGLTKRGSDVRGKVVEAILIGALGMSLIILLVLLVYLLQRSWPVWTDDPGHFLGSGLNSQNPAEAGVWQGIKGTIMLCVIVLLVAIPLGIACAVYLEEYARGSRFSKWTRINVRNLAGVPSIVYGLLGLAIFVKALDGVNGTGRTVIAGGLTLSALVLPIVIITASEALRAVPRSIREGAFGVGATQWETVRSHVLPSAAPGILTGTVLSLARAAGEAAPILLVGAATGLLRTGEQGLWAQLSGGFTAMPVVIFSYARQSVAEYRELTAAAALVLVVLVLVMNAFAVWLRNRYERKW